MISLFVRSYPKDFEWLSHSVKSMTKNLIGISDRVLCVPHGSDVPNDISVFFNRLVFVPEKYPGYIAQQVDKVQAYLYCKHENILFSDSDCIYFQKFDATKMLEGNKIRLYCTAYNTMEGQVLAWKEITRLTTGINPEYEYMRCFPIMHRAKICRHLDELHTYQEYLKILAPNALSEFNALGIIANKYYLNDYVFLDTAKELPLQTAKQYWSWGGITPDISKELETI